MLMNGRPKEEAERDMYQSTHRHTLASPDQVLSSQL